MRCLEENTLFEYVSDGLDTASRQAVVEHAASCESCRRMIAAAIDAAPSMHGAVTEPHGEVRPARSTPPRGPVSLDSERLLAGKYRRLRLLGAGGMGTVHEAVNTWTGRHVAVKELHGSFSADATAVQRFTLEAQSASRIAHPNVVDILDLGADPATGTLFMVQELLTGSTLRQRIADRGKLSLDEALRIIGPALDALVVAHDAGVVHRDLKPDNIFLARDAAGREVTKLIDFGLSKQLREQGGLAITEHGRQLGTPFYMSPEQMRGETDLDDRTDVWSIGVVLFEAVAGVRPFAGPGYNDLVVQILKEPVPKLSSVLPEVSPALSALVSRAIERDRGQRLRIRELRDALDELARHPEVLELPPGNPYRGILPFEADYRGVFFGRTSEVAAVVERLRSESFVLVAGDSGVGKSSLVRAGVLPVVRDGNAAVVMTAPGRQPVAALAAALAPLLEEPPGPLAAELSTAPAAVAVRLQHWLEARATESERITPLSPSEPAVPSTKGGGAAASAHKPDDAQRSTPASASESAPASSSGRAQGVRSRVSSPGLAAPRQIVLFVDQLEELLTLAEPADAATATAALAALLDVAPGLRLIATVRSDFLARLSTLPGLGDAVTRALYLLKPLTIHGVREAIVGPARITGLRFESAALVDELVASAGASGGELPLLQFALAQLWEARDVEHGMIRASALASLGGVSGALARHADGVLAQIAPRHHPLARIVLTGLVTAEGTRARRTVGELEALVPTASEPEATAAVLETLVQGRLVTVENPGGDVPPMVQIAHDFLVDGWDTLRGWRGHDVERGVAQQRLRRAAAEWDRLARPSDLLWSGRQLGEVAELEPRTLSEIEAAFLVDSRSAARRRRHVRRAIALSIPILVGLGFAGARFTAQRHLRDAVAHHVAAAQQALARAVEKVKAVDVLRAEAFAAFDASQRAEGEETWTRVLERQSELEATYTFAGEQLENALALDGGNRDVRRLFAALLYDRARFAERAYRLTERDEQVQRMLAYDDDGTQRTRWNEPARFSVASAPAGAEVIARRYIDERGLRRLADPVTLGIAPLADIALATGSYLLTLRVPGRPDVRAPVVLGRGERVAITVPVPADVPAGYVFVPAGRFLYGSADVEDMRTTMMSAQPLHVTSTDPYLIAQHEVTFADWIAFLRALPPEERAKHRPQTREVAAAHLGAFVDLTEPRPDHFRLTFQPASRAYTADTDQPIHYGERTVAAVQRWTHMPVSGVSWNDALVYAAWLDRTGKLRGARPCNEREWERAARGADDRLFPHGDRLANSDADIASTYGRKPEAFGPDEVGSHPASDSPFGVADLAGNAWEWVKSQSGDELVAIRGGSWYHNQLAARSNNREPSEPALRDLAIGVRICASAPSEGSVR